MRDAIRRWSVRTALFPLSALMVLWPLAGPASASHDQEDQGGDAICVVIDVSDTIWTFGPPEAHTFSCSCTRPIVTSGQVGRVVIQVVDCYQPNEGGEQAP